MRLALGVSVLVGVGLSAEIRAGRGELRLSVEAWAKAIVVEQDATRVAIIAVDSGELDSSTVAAVRSAVEAATSIPAGNVVMCSTRSGGSRANPAKLAEAARLAATAAVPARISLGAGREESISFARRYLMKDGSVRTDPGRLNPDIVQPAVEIDPQVRVLQFETMAGQPIAWLVNFALGADSGAHPATLAKHLSRLQQGSGLMTLYTVGASANLSPVNVKSREPVSGLRIGTILAAEAMKAWARAAPIESPKLKVLRDGEVQVVAFDSNTAIAVLPGDLFVELGTAIKHASPFPETIIVTLANSCSGTIPTRKGFQEGGLDRARLTIEPGGGERLAETALKLLSAARREMSGR